MISLLISHAINSVGELGTHFEELIDVHLGCCGENAGSVDNVETTTIRGSDICRSIGFGRDISEAAVRRSRYKGQARRRCRIVLHCAGKINTVVHGS